MPKCTILSQKVKKNFWGWGRGHNPLPDSPLLGRETPPPQNLPPRHLRRLAPYLPTPQLFFHNSHTVNDTIVACEFKAEETRCRVHISSSTTTVTTTVDERYFTHSLLLCSLIIPAMNVFVKFFSAASHIADDSV